MADTADSKSAAAMCAGSSPAIGTTASQAPYRLRRFFHALHSKSPLHSLRAKTRLLSRKTTEPKRHGEGSRAAESSASFSAFSPQSLTTLRGPFLNPTGSSFFGAQTRLKLFEHEQSIVHDCEVRKASFNASAQTDTQVLPRTPPRSNRLHPASTIHTATMPDAGQ